MVKKCRQGTRTRFRKKGYLGSDGACWISSMINGLLGVSKNASGLFSASSARTGKSGEAGAGSAVLTCPAQDPILIAGEMKDMIAVRD